MKIGIFGLGYVGLTSGACLLRQGYEVIGYETSEAKRSQLAASRVPLSEPGVESTVLAGIAEARFSVAPRVTADNVPDIFFISVGTPSDERGGTNLTAVDSVFSQLAHLEAALLKQRSEIVLRSTVPPGTLRAFARKYPSLFASVPVVFYPEFLREGTAIRDFENPPQTVVGTLTGKPDPTKILSVFASFRFECRLVEAISAESLKFACNAFHALKVCFGNEMGRLVSSFGGNPHEVMELFVQDTQLNISPKYLRPGAPYGGSCLPKDTRSIRNLSASRGLELRTIASCEESNQSHFSYIVERIRAQCPKRLAILGLAFKCNTDDIRESPTVEILYRLATRGDIQLRVHDFLVCPETVIGVNQRLLEKLVALPTIVFSNNLAEVVNDADTVVVMHADKRYDDMTANIDSTVLNVARWTGMAPSPRSHETFLIGRLDETVTSDGTSRDSTGRLTSHLELALRNSHEQVLR